MKIIVKSNAEKELMEKFLKELKSSDIVHEISKDAKLTDDEGSFIFNGFFYSKVEIGDTDSMLINSDEFEGICCECGESTRGVRNRDILSLDEYREYSSENYKKDWRCNSCI